MKRFLDFPHIKEEVFPVDFVEDGLKTSDLNLTALILCCVDGVDCFQAIPENNSPRFLFYIKGDVAKIKEFVDAFFEGKVRETIKSKTENLTQFMAKISYLKMLLDKAKGKIKD